MVAKAQVPLDPVADLRRRLARCTARQVRGCVHTWWDDHGLAAHPAAVGKRIAFALIEQKRATPKLAGALVLHELLADQLGPGDLAGLERLFADGHLADDHLVDWIGAKVLGAMLGRVRGRGELARALARWRDADTVWQRRAACVALATLAPQGEAALPGLCELVFAVCATVVWSPERIDQTAVAGLLRELSRAEPARVAAFFRRYARLMSRECARGAVAKLAAATRVELLAHHRRATTLRRRG
jgi:3-methyladenine DNA glycosylase AlkD